jgi:PrtD family type I secretion system ABC transporter
MSARTRKPESNMPKTAPPLELQTIVQQCRRHVIYAALFSAGISLLYFTPILYMLQVYDRIIPTRGIETLLYITVLAAFALLVMAGLEAARQRIMARMAVRIERLLASAVILRIFAERSRGASAPGGRTLDALRAAIASPGAIAVFDTPWAPLFLLAVFLIHPILGVFVLGGAIVLIVYTIFSQSRVVRAQTHADEVSGRVNTLTDISAPLAGVSRALGFEGALAARHVEERWQAAKRSFEANSGAAAMSSVSRFLRMALQSGVLGLGAWLAIERQIAPSAIFAASILGARCLQPIDQLIGNWRTLVQGWAAYRRLETLLRVPSRETHATLLPRPLGLLSASKLVVAAPDGRSMIIKGVDLRLAPGEIVGLIGPSGAGKSTLAQTLVGALPVQAGEVRIDGADLRQWNPDVLGKFIGYVPQGTALFEGSVADNISRFARWNGADAEMISHNAVAAARAAGAHDMILHLPGGYDTMIGPNGRGLSGGQAQRIALARALYGDPPILVLDEPNAYLDGDGEKALIDAVTAARDRNASVLLIVQRSGFIKHCNRVVVLINGKIAFEGPPDEALARTGGRPPPISIVRKGG